MTRPFNSCAAADWSIVKANQDSDEERSINHLINAFHCNYELGDTYHSDNFCNWAANSNTHFDNQHSVWASEDQIASSVCDGFPGSASMADFPYDRGNNTTEAGLYYPVGQSNAISSSHVPVMSSNLPYFMSTSVPALDDIDSSPHHGQYYSSMEQGMQSFHDIAGKTATTYTLAGPPSTASKVIRGPAKCDNCNQSAYQSLASLEYVSPESSRPLFCIFHYAGCMLRFTSKNEWKRHIMYQHLNLQYWVCTEGGCGLKHRPSSQALAPGMPSHGSFFNRKDLYTQHVRRMHLIHDISSVHSNTNAALSGVSKDHIRRLQDAAARTRCTLPRFMLCPVSSCAAEFLNSTAWDTWIEHVALHMQRAASGQEPPLSFGGPDNCTLTEWAASEAVGITHQTSAGTWTLCKPIHGRGSNPQSDCSRSAAKR
ncbi:hypothetical protein V2A60_005981 [Cordyceps javanica]|uniref:C2H2 finger domain-containing protein n=1 Tax=Cordyceps javanica TaxID=43265 RepID=A0A545VQ57_9HYPO|nr:C2H2 finger domain-containing protein [Cordyceps javanica]TQW03869.1 C2H2 finger domain protein [Cordyceps javanica]